MEANCGGCGTPTHRYEGQPVTSTIRITVAKTLRLRVSASPFPTYRKSQLVVASKLSRIHSTAPSLHQQAVLAAHLELSNGLSIPVSASARWVASSDSDSDSDEVVVNNKGVISAHGGTSTFTVRFGAVFRNYSSNVEYQLEISDDDIFIESIDELRLEVGSTLSGKKGVTSSQLYLGATFTDGRKLQKIVLQHRGAGIAVVGLVCESSPTKSKRRCCFRHGNTAGQSPQRGSRGGFGLRQSVQHHRRVLQSAPD